MESKLQKKCFELAKLNNVLVRKVHVEGRKGFPDLLLVFPVTGRVVFVEMKHPNGKGVLAKLQERELGRLRKQGASAYVCDSYEWFANIIETHLRTDFRSE